MVSVIIFYDFTIENCISAISTPQIIFSLILRVYFGRHNVIDADHLTLFIYIIYPSRCRNQNT